MPYPDKKIMLHDSTMQSNSSQLAVNAVFMISLMATAVMAAIQTLGSKDVFGSNWAKVVVVIALIGAVYVGTQRNTYLPFLGPGVVPPSLLKVGVPGNASIAVGIDAPADAAYVMYWAANPSLVPAPSPMQAYTGYDNAGVVPVAGGKATLRLQCPGAYKVGWTGRVLARHVHYRWVFPTGMTSEIKTLPITCP